MGKICFRLHAAFKCFQANGSDLGGSRAAVEEVTETGFAADTVQPQPHHFMCAVMSTLEMTISGGNVFSGRDFVWKYFFFLERIMLFVPISSLCSALKYPNIYDLPSTLSKGYIYFFNLTRKTRKKMSQIEMGASFFFFLKEGVESTDICLKL